MHFPWQWGEKRSNSNSLRTPFERLFEHLYTAIQNDSDEFSNNSNGIITYLSRDKYNSNKNITLFEKLLVLGSKTATQYAKILLYNCLKALILREEGTTCSISVCFGSRL